MESVKIEFFFFVSRGKFEGYNFPNGVTSENEVLI